MNPQQRRGALLMGIAIVAAFVVFLQVTSYVEQVGEKVEVVQLTADVEAYQPLPRDKLTTALVLVPKDRARMSQLSLEDVPGRVTKIDLKKGDTVTEKNLVPLLAEGEVEYPLIVDAEMVDASIAPGDVVAVLMTRNGDIPQTEIIVPRAWITSVGGAGSTYGEALKALANGGEVPVALALSREDSSRVADAQANGRLKLLLAGHGSVTRDPSQPSGR
jgi:pilus assembly protein CpaB